MVAAVLAWFATRVLRRLVSVAVLAALIIGVGGLAERGGMPVRAFDQVSRCELSELVEVARQPSERDLPALEQPHRNALLRRLMRCYDHRTPTPTPTRRR